MKKTKRRTMYLLLLLILFISVGYAILQSNLSIIGTTAIQDSKWDIHWNNVVITEGSVTGANVTTPATIDSSKTTVNYNIVLDKPGDFYEFTVDAVNEGTIDGIIDVISSKLNNVEITTLPAYLNYSITYSDGTPLQGNQLLAANSSETYKVRIEYKRDIEANQLPETTQTLNLSFTVTYKQATDAATEVIHPSQFELNPWETIIANVRSGNTDNYNVGDTKTVDMGSLGTHTLRIANKSIPAECSTTGFSQTACGFVLEFADIITTHRMNPYDSSVTTIGNGNIGGWPASEMRTYVNSDIYNALPTELKNGIINTTVVSGRGRNDSSNFTSTDKLYLFDAKEIYGDSFTSQYNTAKKSERQLDYYSSQNVTTSSCSGAIKQRNGSNDYWWLRSAASDDNSHFYRVHRNGGSWGTATSNGINGVSPAFRIG